MMIYKFPIKKRIWYLEKSLIEDRKKNPLLNNLFIYLDGHQQIDYGILGGYLRNVYEGDSNKRDIDIIVDTDVESLLLSCGVTMVNMNAFGGYKVNLSTLSMDIWHIKNHWAFKKEKEANWYRIPYTCILNIMSGFYFRSKGILLDSGLMDYYSSYYTLDFFGCDSIPSDAHKESILLKVGEMAYEKYPNFNIGNSLNYFISYCWEKENNKGVSIEEMIRNEYFRHYGEGMSDSHWEKMKKALASNLSVFSL